MTPEFLSSLINNQKTFELFLVFVASFLSIGSVHMLGVRLLKVKINPLKLYISVLVMTIYMILSRFFIPAKINPLIFTGLICISICTYCRTNIFKTLLFSFISVLASMAGETAIGIISIIDKKIGDFILNTSYGITIGILSETLAPAAIILFRKQPIFPGNYKGKEYLPYIMFYSGMFYFVLNSIIDFFTHKSPRIDNLILILFASIFTFGGHLMSVNKIKKEREQDKYTHESEVTAIVDHFEELKQYQRMNKIDIDNLVKTKLRRYLFRNAESFSLVTGVIEDIEKNK